ncbi:MAG: substrate-binding domain-containing protein [Pirellulales bacterium]|nr:substrate-binding domain-containing protein [Pirellulales bacterium]
MKPAEHSRTIVLALLLATGGAARGAAAGEPPPAPAESVEAAAAPAIRCAVIGGMTETGFWDAVADRFTRATGLHTVLVATGPKHVLLPSFARGECDLVTMHACDAMINLVADGLGEDPQPWLRNDLLLVGPEADPAGVRGSHDVVAALARIIAGQHTLLVHRSLGAQEVLHDLLSVDELELDPEHTVIIAADRHRQLLQRAERENAYTLVGRIPFLNGKIPAATLQIMVQGDPRMRRPYLVVVTTPQRTTPERYAAAKRLAAFLRSPETQAWIAEYGKGEIDDRPLFFPVEIGHAAK